MGECGDDFQCRYHRDVAERRVPGCQVLGPGDRCVRSLLAERAEIRGARMPVQGDQAASREKLCAPAGQLRCGRGPARRIGGDRRGLRRSRGAGGSGGPGIPGAGLACWGAARREHEGEQHEYGYGGYGHARRRGVLTGTHTGAAGI
ncbi:hypothetical protein GCM10023353_37560 [Tomitella cavernea]|uniref:Uncharacterized protein n=1 Tax=Tomitella cavernea TaxID=1387982 RepID=A0ABP9D259_9ACTN